MGFEFGSLQYSNPELLYQKQQNKNETTVVLANEGRAFKLGQLISVFGLCSLWSILPEWINLIENLLRTTTGWLINVKAKDKNKFPGWKASAET